MRWRAFYTGLCLLSLSAATQASPIPIGGVVLDDQARPVSGAKVEILHLPRTFEDARTLLGNSEPEAVATLVSEADGRFRGTVPEAGLWRLRVRARGFLSQQMDDVPLVEPAELQAVRLVAAKPLRVKVIGPEGQPVAGARLRLLSPTEDAPRPGTGFEVWHPAPALAVTELDGTAEMALGGFAPTLIAVADGFLEILSKDLKAGEVTLRLGRGCRRWLEVSNPGHRPAAGVLIQSGRSTLGSTGAEGQAAVTVPCGGETSISLWAPDGRRSRVVLRPSARLSVAVRITLPPRAAKLTGRVLDAGQRQPMAGALVWPADDPGAFARTDSQGRYRVRAPMRKGAQLLAIAAGAETALDEMVALGSQGIPSGRGVRQGPTFYLRPAGRVIAQVTDEAGRPVEGAESRSNGFGHTDLARSDRQGALRLKLSGGSDVLELWTTHEGFLPTRSILGAAALRSGARVKIVLRRGFQARVTLLQPDGQPAAGARVVLSPWPGTESGDRQPQAVCDARGIAVFTGVPFGKYDLLAKAPGRAPLRIPGAAVNGAPEGDDLGTFRLEPGGVVEGRVVDLRDRPLGGVTVSHYDPWYGPEDSTETGADGRFSLTALPTGMPIQLAASKEGYAWKSLPALELPAREPVTIVLEARHRVAGTVRDETGAPVREASLTLANEDQKVGSSLLRVASTFRDPEGRFELEVDAAGAKTLEVTAPGYLRKEVSFEVPPEGGVDGLDVVVETAPSFVVGQVTGPAGEPVSQAFLSVSQTRQGVSRSLSFLPFTDSGGRYRVEGLSEGVWQILVEKRGYLRWLRDVEVETGENRLDVQLESGLEVQGDVVDSSDRPVPAANLSLISDSLSRSSGYARSDESGQFLIRGIEPGTYTLNVEGRDFIGKSLTVRVTGSSLHALRVVLEPGGILRGRLLGLEARELERAMVSAHRPGARFLSARADFRGEYELRGLEQGEWTVSADAAARRAEATVSLPAGAGEAVCDLEFPPVPPKDDETEPP